MTNKLLHEKLHEKLHGGELDSAIASFGGERNLWLDLSTCINPYAYKIKSVPDEIWQTLPDESHFIECQQAAQFAFGVGKKTHISLAAGSQKIIEALPYLFKPQSVSVVGFTYSEHAICWQNAGHKIFISDGLESAAQKSKIVIVVNPNNPDGRCYTQKQLLELGKTLKRRGGVLIVDEAFGELVPEHSLVSHIKDSNLIVLRSIGKFYGLAGLRLGFALASSGIGKQLDEKLGHWHVATPALFIGKMVLIDEKWRQKTSKKLKKARKSLESIFNLNGIKIVGGTDLFLLVYSPNAKALWQHLCGHKILTRYFPQRTQWLRFGIAKQTELVRLDKALGSFQK